LAIIALQMIAAYTKQKKEAAAKRQQSQQPQPQPVEFEMPAWKEEEEEESEALEEVEEIEEKEPEFRQVQLPVIASVEEPVFVPPKEHKHKFKTGNVNQGILWVAILQEPRYKVKWKPVCSR